MSFFSVSEIRPDPAFGFETPCRMRTYSNHSYDKNPCLNLVVESIAQIISYIPVISTVVGIWRLFSVQIKLDEIKKAENRERRWGGLFSDAEPTAISTETNDTRFFDHNRLQRMKVRAVAEIFCLGPLLAIIDVIKCFIDHILLFSGCADVERI